jgi:yecA family protein
MLGDSSLTKRERADLTAFLDAHREQGGLDIFTLEGFLCAVACGPSAVNPSIWLAFVFGEGPPRNQQTPALSRTLAPILA